MCNSLKMKLKRKLNLMHIALLLLMFSALLYSSIYFAVITYRGGAGGKLELFSIFLIVVALFLLPVLSFHLLIGSLKDKKWYSPMYLILLPLGFLPLLLLFYSSIHSNDILREHFLVIVGSIFICTFLIRISLRRKFEKILSAVLLALAILYSAIILLVGACFNYYGDSTSIVVYSWYAQLATAVAAIFFIPCFITWLILYIRNLIKKHD